MGILKRISSPADLRRLSDQQLAELADEIRQFLVEKVSATGGHLGPNLGVVELTLALHRVFDSPYEPIIFDTSHQSYVHKIITGRAAGFDQLRQKGGLSGYTSRGESEHDWTESSHASAALSYADGLSKAYSIQDKLKAADIQVVLIAQPYFSTSALFGKASDNPIYKEIAAAEKVPLYAGGWSEILSNERLKSDQIHANPAGYRQFAQGLFVYLQDQGLAR